MTSQENIDGFSVTMKLSNTKKPKWSNSVHNHYKVRIAKDGKSHIYDFFGSVSQAERGHHPTISDALNCFAMDILSGQETFEDFCLSMGGSTDSIRDREAWKACQKVSKAAKKLGITEEILYKWTGQED